MRIERMESSRHIRGRFLLHLSDGQLIKVTDNEVVSFRLTVGTELDDAALARLKAAAAENNAKALGAKLLGRKPMSRKQLVEKLTEKEIAPADADSAADWLEELGVLDDAAYGAAVVRHYARRGYGPGRIRQELYRRGVPRELWEDAMAGDEAEESGLERYVERMAGRRDLRDPKERKRLCDALLRRGYSWAEVKNVLRRFGADGADLE